MVEIIYLNNFRNLMIQRPHQLLRKFAGSGYQSILYNMNSSNKKIIEAEKNYFIYDGIFPDHPKKEKRILWISYPPLYKEVGKYQEDLVVFDCIDYPEGQFSNWGEGINEIRERADVIFAASKGLYEYNQDFRTKTFICNNGVDFDFFSTPNRKIQIPPKDIRNIKRPIVGYIGAVADWIDWDLIRYLDSSASGRFSLVFIGPLFRLKKLPVVSSNVYFLGRKDYNTLPAYLSLFDVCMIPFQKSRMTDACNPIKMYEYLSAGKPVVTTDLEECRIDVVNHAKTYEEFYNHIMNSLGPPNAVEERRRTEFAKKNSWESRAKYMRTIIEPMLEIN